MGIRDHINSGADTLNRHALTPAKNIGWTSYSYVCAAATRIDTAVRVHALPKVYQRLQDEETRSMMSHLATNCAKTALFSTLAEASKTVPGGGPIYDIISKSIVKKGGMENHKEKIKKLEAEVKVLKREMNELKRSGNQCEADNYMDDCGTTARLDYFEEPKGVNETPQVAVVGNFMNRQHPDSAIRRFMMEGFVNVLEYEVKSEN